MAKKKSLVQLIFFALLFFLVLLSFLGYPDKLLIPEEESSSVEEMSVRGLSIMIKGSGKWDLFEYVCKRNENCEQSPTAGRRLSTVSGGGEAEEEHEVVIDYDETWSEYERVKLFVRPAPDSEEENFRVEEGSEIPRSEVRMIGEEKNQVEALIIPVNALGTSYHELAVTFESN